MPNNNDDNLITELNQLKERQEEVINRLQEIKQEQDDSEVIKQLDEIERSQWNAILEIEELKKHLHPFKAQALAIADIHRRAMRVSRIPRRREGGMEL
jgi:uncharacterized protein (DUF1015 family)